MKNPKIFIQQCGSYTNEVLVICGATKSETLKFLRKNKAKFEIAKWVLGDFDKWKERVSGVGGGLYCFNDVHHGHVLFLHKVDAKGNGSWIFWEAVMHEIHHLVLHISKLKSFQDEWENQAYLFDYLFRNIRRKIQGVDKIA